MNNYDDACGDLTEMFWRAMDANELGFATELLNALAEWGDR